MALAAFRVRAERQLESFLWSLLLMVAIWPVPTLEHVSSVDGSVFAALHMAATTGIDFGSDFLYTYGPLGWFAVPQLFYVGTAAGAVAMGAVAQSVLAYLLLRQGRTLLGDFGAPIFAACLLAMSLFVGLPEVLLIITFILCIKQLRDPQPERTPFGYTLGAGAFCALVLLIKVSVGLACVALVVTTLMFSSSRSRDLGSFSGAFVAIALGLWIVTGQEISDLQPFLIGSIEVLSGYSTALTVTARSGNTLMVPVFSVIAIGGIVASLTRGPQPARVPRAVVTAVFIYFSMKSGFVRQDAGHLNIYLTLLLFALAISLPSPDSKIGRIGLAIGIVILFEFFVAFVLVDPGPRLRPITDISRPFDQVGTLLYSERASDLLETNREEVRTKHPLDATTLSILDGKKVHVDPWQSDVVWAQPGVDWRPLPISQNFMAYTNYLDARNATAVEGDRAPQIILRQDRSLEQRSTTFDPPRTQLAILCNYAPIRTTVAWQILNKTADRCDRPRVFDRVATVTGAEVVVPINEIPEQILAVRILGLSNGSDRFRSFLFRREPWFLIVDQTTYRLNPLTASGPLILGVPSVVDSPEPFRIGDTPSSLEVVAPPGEERHIDLEFLSIPIHP